MTLGAWRRSAQRQLSQVGITSAAADSALIAGLVVGGTHAEVIARSDQVLPPRQRQRADALLRRRLEFEPMAYLMGVKEFYGLEFDCDARALIPRGESETVVDAAIGAIGRLAADAGNLVVAEVGTGSGAIVCALASRAPGHRYIATDVSPDALGLAKQNAAKFGLGIEFMHGDLFEPLNTIGSKIDILVANLPYIPDGLLVSLDPTIRYFEPAIALAGGDDGLTLYRRFFAEASRVLARRWTVVVEHEFDQALAIGQLIGKNWPAAHVVTLQDRMGHDRVTIAASPT